MVELSLKIGDIVIIHSNARDWNVRMNEYIGQIRKVAELKLDNKGMYVNFELESDEDGINQWYWRPTLHFSHYTRKTKKIKLKF